MQLTNIEFGKHTMKALCLNVAYSTTKLLITSPRPSLNSVTLDSISEVDQIFEGGLRPVGFIKRSYRICDGRWYMCDCDGVVIEEINFVNSITRSSLPLISIITVVFNGVAHIEQTIKSVLNQSYPNVEYIIIDGGSTDGTLDIIRKYNGEIDYWISERDGGIFDAMNKGIALATGTSIGLLNCGDQYHPDFISNLCSGLNDGQISYSVLYSDYSMRFEDLNIEMPSKSTFQPWKGMSICHQAMLIGNGIYKRFGLYDVKYSFAADYEYFLKISDVDGVEFIYRPFQGVSFLHGGASNVHQLESLFEAYRINSVHFKFRLFSRVGFLLVNGTQYFVGVVSKNLIANLFGEKYLKRIRILKKAISMKHYKLLTHQSNSDSK